jgi:hypothetical protein
LRSFLASASTGSLLEKASIFTVFFKKQVYLPSKDLDCPRDPETQSGFPWQHQRIVKIPKTTNFTISKKW